MSAHVLLNSLNELGKDKMRGFAEHLPNEFNKFNNTGARMKNSIYYTVSYDTKIAFY